MLKNLLTLATFVAIAISAQALDITSNFGSTKWNCTLVEATKTVTFNEDWGGCGWYVGGVNYSDYTTLDVTIEPSTLNLSLVVTYSSDGNDKDIQSFAPGTTDLSIILNPEKSTYVYSMYISNEALTDTPTVTLVSANLVSETTTVYNGSFDLGGWDQQLDLLISKFAYTQTGSVLHITYDLNDGQEYGAFSLSWIDANWNWVNITSLSTMPGYDSNGYIVVKSSGELYIPLDDSDIENLVNKGGKEVAVKGSALTITNIELISPVNKTFEGKGYVSFSSKYNRAVPEGMKVYTAVVNNEHTEVVVTEVETNVIPANTGVLLYWGSSETKNLKVTNDISTGNFSDNELVATSLDENITIVGTAYGLHKGENAFAPITSGITLSPTKAYIPVLGNAPAMMRIRLNNEVTGIYEAACDNADETYYNLQGIRVDNPQNGVFIRNSKAIYVK